MSYNDILLNQSVSYLKHKYTSIPQQHEHIAKIIRAIKPGQNVHGYLDVSNPVWFIRLYNIDVADSEPESGEFKPDIPQNAVQKVLEMISSSFSCGIPVNSSSVGSGMASDDEPANLTKRNLYLLMFARAVLMAILLIQAYIESRFLCM